MGSIGILKVRNEYKKRGFGSTLVQAYSKLAVATYNVDMTAHIMTTNEASKALFTKLGFNEIHQNSWLGFKKR